jgi:hypothetical protein
MRIRHRLLKVSELQNLELFIIACFDNGNDGYSQFLMLFKKDYVKFRWARIC